jgi:hypothetical protein
MMELVGKEEQKIVAKVGGGGPMDCHVIEEDEVIIGFYGDSYDDFYACMKDFGLIIGKKE